MYAWNRPKGFAELSCEDACGAKFGVSKNGFTAEEWGGFGPEEMLKQMALDAQWQYLFDATKNVVVFVCKDCVNVRTRK